MLSPAPQAKPQLKSSSKPSIRMEKINVKLRRRISPYLILLLLSALALAQKPGPHSESPSADRLRETVKYLASDELEGRRTGSPGANEAANYIAREFWRLGLSDAKRSSEAVSNSFSAEGIKKLQDQTLARYQQPFPYVAGVELGKSNLFYVNHRRADDTVPLKVSEDWMPLGFSSNGDIKKAGYVFVGYGITDAELKYDSYAGHSWNNTVAIALSGTPDGDNPHGQFARYEDPHWKAIAARNAGAKALFIIATEENFNDDRLSRLRYDNSAGEAGIPVAVISWQTAARLFPSGSPKDVLSLLTRDAKDEAKIHAAIPDRGGDASLTQDPNITPAMVSSLPLNGVTLSVSLNIARHEVPAANVIGILEGSDPQLKNEAIVLGAHYDHLGRGGEGSLASREGEIHHGADDNASGVAGLLELARILSSQPPRPRRTVVFIAFSGEEEGLIGSSYYVNHPVWPLANVAAMINMDMIGRLKENKLIVGGVGTAPEWRNWLDQANPPVAMTAVMRPRNTVADRSTPGESSGNLIKELSLTLNEDGFGPSDHSSFYLKKVPVLFLFTGSHDDYHKPSDTFDKINYEGEARIVAFVDRVVRLIDKTDKRPTYAVAKSDSTGRASGFRVYLGTIPNYAETNEGLLLDGVRDDSPAAKAGLKAGDRIVKLAGRDVKNVYDYTAALGEMKAGQEYEVEALRGTERLKLKLTPAARK
jgi:hypothetical protein